MSSNRRLPALGFSHIGVWDRRRYFALAILGACPFWFGLRHGLYANIVKKFFNLGDPDPSMVKQGEKRFHRFAAALDGHLQTRDYLVGRGMTLADISVGSYLMFAKE